MLTVRASGILLHLTSLPNRLGIGDLGPEALKFIDFLAQAGQGYWQVLPTMPTMVRTENSPYRATSAFAGNPLLISLELLCQEGLLHEDDLEACSGIPCGRVDYRQVTAAKHALLALAWKNHKVKDIHAGAFQEFCQDNAIWLDDFALFTVLQQGFAGLAWCDFPTHYRLHEPEALARYLEQNRDDVNREKFKQFIFYRQWHALRRYANENAVQIIGDMPIYVGYDSSDVWSHPHLFKLYENGHTRAVAGVPPDRFSHTGQRWGNPVFDWGRMRHEHYGWWIARLKHSFAMFDAVRIDHFRGFLEYWEIPSHAPDASHGSWQPGPGEHFFQALQRYRLFPPIIVEDLGTITPDVRELVDKLGFPGMRVLQFGFEDDSGATVHLPHNHVPNAVLYTGTHDNNTLRGWFEDELDSHRRLGLSQYLGHPVSAGKVSRELVRMAMMSVCRLTIIPMQELLDAGSDARMNRPGIDVGNWEWRLAADIATPELAATLREMVIQYGRI